MAGGRPVKVMCKSGYFLSSCLGVAEDQGMWGVVIVIVWQLDLQLSMQSVPIATNVSSNPIHWEVYSIQHYVIKFFSELRQVSGFLQVLRFPSESVTQTAMLDSDPYMLSLIRRQPDDKKTEQISYLFNLLKFLTFLVMTTVQQIHVYQTQFFRS